MNEDVFTGGEKASTEVAAQRRRTEDGDLGPFRHGLIIDFGCWSSMIPYRDENRPCGRR